MSGSRHDDLLTRILSRIPGFRGYAQQEDRRASEQQTRAFVNAQLHQAKVSLDGYSRSLADAGLIDQLSPLEKLRDSVESARSQVDRPVLGSGGLIGADTVEEDALEDLYDLEATLMDQSVSVNQACGKLDDPAVDAGQQLKQIQETVSELNALVTRRKQSLERLTE